MLNVLKHMVYIVSWRKIHIKVVNNVAKSLNSFRLLATLFKTKNSIDMRILSGELSQLKRIAIINAI